MINRSNRAFLILVAISIIVFSCRNKETVAETALPYFNTPEFNPEWKNELKQPLHNIGDFSFTNQDGEIVNNKTVENKIYIANFFFTICPGICPVMTENMYDIQNHFKGEESLLLLSHTVTPWIDNVDRLHAYAKEKKVKSGKWHLLTGPEEEIYDLARLSYFADKEIGHKSEEEDFLHTENFLLIDKKGHIRGIYNGTVDSDISRLKEDVEVLLLEK